MKVSFSCLVAQSILAVASSLAVCPVRGQTASLEAAIARANAAQSADRYDDAASAYARATTLSPMTPELWSNRGVMEYLAGHPDIAIVSLKHTLRLNSKMFVPMLFLGKAYLDLGKPDQALPWLEQVHKLRPVDSEIVITLAKAEAALGRQEDAESAYSEAARLAPENPAAWFGLGGASLQVIASNGQGMAKSQPQSVWARALLADDLLAQGRPLEAIDIYHGALATASIEDKTTLSRTVDWLKQHPDLFPLPDASQKSLDELDSKLASKQDGAAPLTCTPSATSLRAAACSFWAGDYEQSAREAAKALKQSPLNAEALYWSIKSNERIAVAALARFEELAPQSAASYVMVGDLFRNQNEIENALDAYKKALAINAHNPGALLGSIVADLAGSRLDEAADLDRTALAANPADPQLNLLMAEIFAAQNRFNEARLYLAKCLSGPPEMQSRVHLLLGRADADEGKNEEAIREYEIASSGDKDGSIHYQLSRLYRKTGNVLLAQKAEAEAKFLINQRRANAAIEVREAAGQSSRQ